MALTVHEIARMVDLSAVRAETDEAEVRQAAEVARRYACACLFTLPTMTPLAVTLLEGSGVGAGGCVGFPSGGQTTTIKATEARALLEQGCAELDMVIAVGLLKSGRDAQVRADVAAVVEAAEGAPVKVILECHHLTDDEILRACGLAVEAGAAWIKTATGWASTGATRHNIALIAQTVAGRAGVKAAGGIRDRETLLAFYDLGARRFGISHQSALRIFQGQAGAEDATY
jgi:deoxyribose-phosphate aldolase